MPMTPRIAINIVAWNSMRFLPDLLASIEAQTWREFSVLVIDNGSDDGVEAWLRQNYPSVALIRNARNLGFAPAHNQGIRYAIDHWPSEDLSERFVLVTNPDIIFTPTYLETLMVDVGQHPEAASFGGKLLRAFGEHTQDEVLKETVHSDVIDSTGLVATTLRAFADRGAGEIDAGQYEKTEEVFGISGALALYRASALAAVRYQDEFFDHDFFAYKEDIDLAWRFQLCGWSACYVPSAVAYHYRGMFAAEEKGVRAFVGHRRGQSARRRFYSIRNHWNMLMKNELFVNGLLCGPGLLPKEIARIGYVAVLEPSNLRAFAEALWRLPRMWKKRLATMRSRRATAKEMRRWFA